MHWFLSQAYSEWGLPSCCHWSFSRWPKTELRATFLAEVQLYYITDWIHLLRKICRILHDPQRNNLMFKMKLLWRIMISGRRQDDPVQCAAKKSCEMAAAQQFETKSNSLKGRIVCHRSYVAHPVFLRISFVSSFYQFHLPCLQQ